MSLVNISDVIVAMFIIDFGDKEGASTKSKNPILLEKSNPNNITY